MSVVARGTESRERTTAAAAGIALRKRLLRGSGVVLAGMIVSTILGVAVNGLLARLLTHPALGSYFLAFSLASFGAQIGVLGMDRAVVRTVSSSLATGRPGAARSATVLAFVFALSASVLVAAALVIGLGGFLARQVYHSTAVSSVVVLAAAWLVGLAMQTLVAEAFRGFQRFGMATLFAGLSVDVLGVVVFGALWFSGASPSLHHVLALMVAIIAGSTVVGGLALARRVRSLGREGVTTPGEMFSIGWPLLITNVLTFMVGTGIDLWILSAFAPRSDVALYGAASRLVFFVGTSFIVVSQVVPPIIAELHAQGRKEELERSLRQIATLAGLPASIVLMAMLLFGAPIMRLVYGGFFARGATVLAILSCARLYAVVTGNSGALLMMTGHQKTMMRITSVSAVYAVAASILLASRFGMVGVAIATATAQVLQNTLQLVFGHRRLGIWTHAELSPAPVVEFVRAIRSRA